MLAAKGFGLAAVLVSLVVGWVPSAWAAGPAELLGSSTEESAAAGDTRQGWNRQQREWFHHLANQGSRLVPYKWFLWLERPDSEQLLRDNAHIEELRFLPEQVDPVINPDGLPIGFVEDTVPDAERRTWLGLTCAACHTARITYKGNTYLVDGGPGQGDIQTFQTELTTALEQTEQDDAKFARFARGVLGASAGNTDKVKALREDLKAVAKRRHDFDDRNKTDSKYGFARVDAFGIIMNEVLGHALGVPGNVRPPNAPVSFPFLWDAPQHEHVQWNGVAPNRPLKTNYVGPLARNVGEVLGVFGEVSVTEADTERRTFLLGLRRPRLGYESSARRVNLLVIEELLKRLTSPTWPKEFPAIDEDQAREGQELFAQHCAECHQEVVNPTGLSRIVGEVMTPISEVGTDPLMAQNFANRRVDPGPLVGKKKLILIGPRFQKDESARDVLVHVVGGAIIRTPFEKISPLEALEFNRLLGGHQLLDTLVEFIAKVHADFDQDLDVIAEKILKPLDEMYQLPDPEEGLVYKARPLNGIWATAPYLHNGSVPNLEQLLLPAKDRVTEFYVGSREFDPEKVGFESEEGFAGAFKFRVKGDDGQVIPGNSNAGHEYGQDLDEDERAALVEYMKAL